MHTIATTPTNVQTIPIQFTKPEKDRLLAAKAELQRLDQLLADVARIKTVIDRAAEDFANGKLSIAEAVGLLSGSRDSAARAELEGSLRRPLKIAIRRTVDSVADLIQKASQHHVGELAAKCRALEAGERATLVELGMSQDEFVPSDLLLGLREQHHRATLEAAKPVGRDALNKVLAHIE